MTEQAPSQQGPAAEGEQPPELRLVDTPDWQDTYPAAAALHRYVSSHHDPNKTKAHEQAEEWPFLALDCIREKVHEEGDKLLPGLPMLRGHITAVHNRFGPFYPSDEGRRYALDSYRGDFVAIAAQFAHIPEIREAFRLLEELHDIGDDSGAHGMTTVLAAYGREAERMQRLLGQRATPPAEA